MQYVGITPAFFNKNNAQVMAILRDLTSREEHEAIVEATLSPIEEEREDIEMDGYDSPRFQTPVPQTPGPQRPGPQRPPQSRRDWEDEIMPDGYPRIVRSYAGAKGEELERLKTDGWTAGSDCVSRFPIDLGNSISAFLAIPIWGW